MTRSSQDRRGRGGDARIAADRPGPARAAVAESSFPPCHLTPVPPVPPPPGGVSRLPRPIKGDRVSAVLAAERGCIPASPRPLSLGHAGFSRRKPDSPSSRCHGLRPLRRLPPGQEPVLQDKTELGIQCFFQLLLLFGFCERHRPGQSNTWVTRIN